MQPNRKDSENHSRPRNEDGGVEGTAKSIA